MSMDDILSAAQAAESEVLDSSKPQDEDIVIDLNKKDELIDKTIESKRRSLADLKEGKSAKKKIFSKTEPKSSSVLEKEEPQPSFSYSYGSGYNNNYYYGTQRESNEEKIEKEKAEKVKKLFRENVSRIEKEQEVCDIFTMHKDNQTKKVSKKKDAMGRGLITALITSLNKLCIRLEDF